MKVCAHIGLRVKVNLFLDIPSEHVRCLNKKVIRSKQVKIDGAGWDTMLVYCPKCGYTNYYGNGT